MVVKYLGTATTMVVRRINRIALQSVNDSSSCFCGNSTIIREICSRAHKHSTNRSMSDLAQVNGENQAGDWTTRIAAKDRHLFDGSPFDAYQEDVYSLSIGAPGPDLLQTWAAHFQRATEHRLVNSRSFFSILKFVVNLLVFSRRKSWNRRISLPCSTAHPLEAMSFDRPCLAT